MAGHAGWRFTRLELQNWRNFGNCEMRLAQRVFIVGPNASGKSNLLDVFQFLHDLVSVGGGLQAALKERGGVSSVRALHARKPSDIRILVEVGSDVTKPAWRYEIAFNARAGKPAELLSEKAWRGTEATPVIDRPDEADKSDRVRLTQTAIEQINLNSEVRDLVAFFRSICFRNLVPQFVRESDWAIKKDDPYGSDLIQRINDAPEKTRKRRLDNILPALRIAVPQFSALEPLRDNAGIPHLRAKYQNWRGPGAWQSEERFSDGTLRLLGLLWELQEKGGPLLLEEPEISLHNAVVRQLPAQFARVQKGGRQIIVTTHSEALLSDAGIGLNEVYLLSPQQEGTTVEAASTSAEIRAMLEAGHTMGEIVLPRTAPREARQLSLLNL